MQNLDSTNLLSPQQFIGFIFAALIITLLYRRWRAWRLQTTPFPKTWHTILIKNIPVYKKLTTELQAQLKLAIKQFIRDKTFYGCNGLEITDEMRVTVAGEACMLLLNRQTSHYDKLQSILLYPASFVTSKTARDEAGLVSQQENHLLGESWQQGKVILSWQDVLRGAENFTDGQNVVLHEFAHQLDQESGAANGAPLLGEYSSYQRWSSVLAKEFSTLQCQSEHGFPSLIDQYGATNPAEFFAVVTETFFERPMQLHKKHPELFAQMKEYYALDPREWL